MAIPVATHLAHALSHSPMRESISYNGTTINAIVDRSGRNQESYIRGREVATCVITVSATDVPTPAHGDAVTIDGETWYHQPEGVIVKNDYLRVIALERELA